MNLSAQALGDILDRHPPSSRYWIAYSGGLDSRVLLRLCAELRTQRPAFDCAAVHVHHGLQAAADAWADTCRATCRAEGIPFELARVDARSRPGQSPEEAARAARYLALRGFMAPGDTLLTAQHRDDQAETLLLQLLRGAGLAGLAAMPERAEFAPGFLARPLLAFSRRELHGYATAHGLAWIEDPSNLDPAYDRNFIRHQVMPLLAQRWPSAPATLSRSARHCAEAQASLATLAHDLYRSALNPERDTLRVDRLLACTDADRRLVLREWLKAGGFRMPSARVLAEVLREALAAAPDRNPVVRWSEGEIRRYRDELFLLPPARPFAADRVMAWDGYSPLTLPDGNGILEAKTVDGPGIAPELWRTAAISVRYRQGGETCRPVGRTGSHELKKLFQEAGIPPWVRERTPLVYLDGRLAAVAGGWVCADCAGGTGGGNIAVEWQAPTGCSGAPPHATVRD